MAKVVPLAMNDETLRRKISAIASASLHSASPKVILLSHAKQQMRRRKVLLTQVYDTLIRGVVIEHAHRDIKGCWKCTLSHLTAGERVKVAAALCLADDGEIVVVITVMN